MKTLHELESLPPLADEPMECARCGKPFKFVASQIIVYRCPIRGNVSFEEARFDDSVVEVVTAEVCEECNDELYNP